MKKIYLLGVLFTFLFSCSKNPNVVLPRKNGVWDFTLKEIIKGPNASTDTYSGTLIFKESVTGTIMINGAASVLDITWIATNDNVTLKINTLDALVYEVTSKTRKTETWHRFQSIGNESIDETFNLVCRN